MAMIEATRQRLIHTGLIRSSLLDEMAYYTAVLTKIVDSPCTDPDLQTSIEQQVRFLMKKTAARMERHILNTSEYIYFALD